MIALRTQASDQNLTPMTPLELVEHISEGKPWSAAELTAFLQENAKEGQYLDYKSGLLAEDAQGSAKLCRHVTGMANATGGVLIIGVRDDRTIDGVSAKGGRGAKGWAENCVARFAALFSTPPHFCEVACGESTVLVVAIHRNSRLIPVIESGRGRHYLRLGDQTLEAPDFHVADLLLGRREQPIVEVRAERGHCSEANPNVSYTLELDLFNEGSIWVEEVQVGLIGLHVYEEKQAKDKLPNAMRANLEVVAPVNTFAGNDRINLRHYTASVGKMPPLSGSGVLRLGPLAIDGNYLNGMPLLYINAAVFCVPRHGSIQWFQLSCGIAHVMYNRIMASPPKLTPVNGSLIEVAWHRIKPQEGLRMDQDNDWEALLKEHRLP